MRSVTRKVWLLGVVVVVAVGAVTAFASAAPGNRPAITIMSPSPTEGATLTSEKVSFAFTYNRKPNATGTLTCSLSGPTSSTGACDTPTALGTKDSESGKSYSGLANGAYTFTVSLTLTDGGTASATRSFTISGHVYWVNQSVGLIGRADLAGTNVNQSFIAASSAARGVAVDSAHVYWARVDRIGRSNLDGTNANQNFITGASNAWGVAVDSTYVYWTNFATGTIGRANLDGTNVNQNFITGAVGPLALTVDSGHVYWTNYANVGRIGRANLDGTNVDNNFISGAHYPVGLAVDSGHIYWSNQDAGGTIGRANLDGTNVDQNFITGLSFPYGIAVGFGYVYWASLGTNTIGRANADGTSANQNFITGATFPIGMAVGAD